MSPNDHRLLICTTCRRADWPPDSPRDGLRLYEAVMAAWNQRPDRTKFSVASIECMNGCERGCTAALSAPGKPTYFFGDLEPNAATAEQALALAESYCDKPNGVLLPSRRPPAFRAGILAKIPPLTAGQAAAPTFDAPFRDKFVELLKWRRDVRHFKTDPLPANALHDLLAAADLAPSVGLSQPWRFVTVDDPARRQAIRDNFEASNRDALALMQGERAAHYAKLKLAGLNDAPCHFAVFADPDPAQGHGLGRLTMPEMTDYSAAIAVHTLWLMARTLGLGLGWVSILDPAKVADALDVPATWHFIGYFCLGYPKSDSDIPELEQLAWEHRQTPATSPIRR